MRQINRINRIVLVLVALIVCINLIQCSSPTGPLQTGNLLKDPSFESNGQPTLSGWTINDTSIVHFTNDAPPDGGKWSVAVNVVWIGPNMLEVPYQKIKLISGTKIYTFSFWAKSSSAIKGIGSILAFKADSLVSYKYVRVGDSTWTNYSIADTLSSDQADSLCVTVSGGVTELAGGKTYFDLCSLTAK